MRIEDRLTDFYNTAVDDHDALDRLNSALHDPGAARRARRRRTLTRFAPVAAATLVAATAATTLWAGQRDHTGAPVRQSSPNPSMSSSGTTTSQQLSPADQALALHMAHQLADRLASKTVLPSTNRAKSWPQSIDTVSALRLPRSKAVSFAQVPITCASPRVLLVRLTGVFHVVIGGVAGRASGVVSGSPVTTVTAVVDLETREQCSLSVKQGTPMVLDEGFVLYRR